MPDDWFGKLERELNQLREKDRLRFLRANTGVDFGSNDYLGFALDLELHKLAIESLRDTALSASSSRLLPGHHSEHLTAEKIFADFVGAESALLFNSGYDANMALLTTLPTRHDLILYDERSHASIYDGVHASLAKSLRFAHNSSSDLRRILKLPHSGQVFIVLESVYSMDGDVAAIDEVSGVALEANAIMIVDEAHATGVLGSRGQGLVNQFGRQRNMVGVHTCGKALGAAGAFVVGSATIKEYLINKARQLIYTTALPPLIPMQIMHSVQKLQCEGVELVATLHNRSVNVRRKLRSLLKHWEVSEGNTPIISITIGADRDALRASQALAARGVAIPAVRPPTVPDGTARLRMNISLRHSEEELEQAVQAIVAAEKEFSV